MHSWKPHTDIQTSGFGKKKTRLFQHCSYMKLLGDALYPSHIEPTRLKENECYKGFYGAYESEFANSSYFCSYEKICSCADGSCAICCAKFLLERSGQNSQSIRIHSFLLKHQCVGWAVFSFNFTDLPCLCKKVNKRMADWKLEGLVFKFWTSFISGGNLIQCQQWHVLHLVLPGTCTISVVLVCCYFRARWLICVYVFSHPAGLVMSESYFRFHYIAFSKYSEYIFIQIK